MAKKQEMSNMEGTVLLLISMVCAGVVGALPIYIIKYFKNYEKD